MAFPRPVDIRLLAPLTLPASPGKPLTTEGGNTLDSGAGDQGVPTGVTTWGLSGSGWMTSIQGAGIDLSYAGSYQCGLGAVSAPALGGDGTNFYVSANTGSIYLRSIPGTQNNASIVTTTGFQVCDSAGAVTTILPSDGGISTTPPAVATPAVPASATALTNSTGVDVMVYIAGGTVTAVEIGTVTTGLVAGGFYLANGETITLTYTAAPTWQWLAI